MQITKQFIYILSMICVFQVNAANTSIETTKIQLKQLESKMKYVQDNINHAHDKHHVLEKELSITEKQLRDAANSLKKIHVEMSLKLQEIKILTEKNHALTQQLETQQHLLASHLRARYKMGEYQPLKWLFNQDKPDLIGRVLTYHQYLVHSRENVMDSINELQNKLNINQNKLKHDIIAQTNLQHELNQHQKIYDHDKQHRKALINTLTQEINNQQATLRAYQTNKNNLSRILITLAQRSVLQSRHPLTHIRHQLPNPIVTNASGMQKVNQGVIFFANEASVVKSVAPGKVVFSDWLNGYGLLIIVDHGWGFMTLYANNKSLLKHKGNSVNQNESIAIVGHSGTFKQNGLYFEIRHHGKAINPLEWLSKRLK